MRMFNPDGTEWEMSNVTFATVVSRDYIKIRDEAVKNSHNIRASVPFEGADTFKIVS